MLGVVQTVVTGNRQSSGESIKPLIRRYCYRFRRRLWKFASASDRQADLVSSFPAAVVSLVTRGDDDAARWHAERLVESGAPLSRIASVLGIPVWMRRLPPEAFAAPLERAFSEHWHKAAFASLILNAQPKDVARAGRWLQTVIDAEIAGGPEFAAWMAGHKLHSGRRIPTIPVGLLALYAWYSGQNHHPAGQMIHAPWNEKMSLGRTACLTQEWCIRVVQDLCLDPAIMNDVWFRPLRVRNIEIVPLITAASLQDEGRTLRNCLARYVSTVAQGMSHIYSLRADGVRLAAMEVRRSEATGLPRIMQICGPCNTKPPRHVVEAAAEWLILQIKAAGPEGRLQPPRHSDLVFQNAIWLPFVEARVADVGNRFTFEPPSTETMVRGTLSLGALHQH